MPPSDLTVDAYESFIPFVTVDFVFTDHEAVRLVAEPWQGTRALNTVVGSLSG